MKSSSLQSDQSSDPTHQEISAVNETAVTTALNALYMTDNSRLEPHIEALGLKALRSKEWSG